MKFFYAIFLLVMAAYIVAVATIFGPVFEQFRVMPTHAHINVPGVEG